MEMTGLQIFKYLPGGKKTHEANCKKCGCPTCMAYALKLAKQNTELEKCPHISEDLRQKYLHSAKHAQETISIGDLKIGGENVLYRHEKTFINRTTLAVVVDCAESYYKEKLERISNFIRLVTARNRKEQRRVRNGENGFDVYRRRLGA